MEEREKLERLFGGDEKTRQERLKRLAERKENLGPDRLDPVDYFLTNLFNCAVTGIPLERWRVCHDAAEGTAGQAVVVGKEELEIINDTAGRYPTVMTPDGEIITLDPEFLSTNAADTDEEPMVIFPEDLGRIKEAPAE